MWLVLCSPVDAAALWAFEGLKRRGLAPIELVTDEDLAFSRRWMHSVSTTGCTVEITLADGRQISSDSLRGVLNRLSVVSQEHLALAHPDDRDYVLQEMTAFYLSWIHALPCPVINRSTAQGLSGPWRPDSEWLWMAARAGLPTTAYVMNGTRRETHGGLVPPNTPVQSVYVVADQAVGISVPDGIRLACVRLARLAGIDLLGVDFTENPTGGWSVARATPYPDLRSGGEALLDALAHALSQKAEVGQ